jgi:hypothetical protein
MEGFLGHRFSLPRRGLFRAITLALLAVFVASSAQLRPPDAQAVGTASGVYFGAYGGSEEQSSIDILKAQGVQGVRMYIEWSELEPTEDYNTSSSIMGTDKLYNYDSRLASLSAAGIKPILMVGHAPTWAASRERGPLFPGKDASFARFLSKMVARWSAAPYNAHNWELWPEPDFGDSIPSYIKPEVAAAYQSRRAWGDNGADYAAMLKLAYPAIKAVDSTAIVQIGALAHDNFRNNGAKPGDNRSSPGFNEGGVFVYHFLDDVIDAGGGPYFDWMGFNAYSVFAPGWEKDQNYTAWDLAAKAKHIQGRLAAKGLSKPLIVMEAGIWSCCTNGTGFNFYTKPDRGTSDFTPDERTQGAYMTRTYLRGLTVDLKGVNWWLIRDFEAPNVQVNPDNHRGWYRTDSSAKPAAKAYKLMTTRLTGATYGGTYTPARTVSGQQLEAYSFTRADGGTVIAMWNPYRPADYYGSEDTSVVEVDAAGYIIYNAVGEAVTTTSVGGSRVRLTVGYMPVFMETFGSLGNTGMVPLLPKSSNGV